MSLERKRILSQIQADKLEYLTNIENFITMVNQVPKRPTHILISSKDSEAYTIENLADRYPFIREKNNVIIVGPDTIEIVMDQNLSENDLLFFPKIGLAIALHDEAEISFNKSIDNGIEMEHTSSIASVHITGGEEGNTFYNTNTNWGLDMLKVNSTELTGANVTIAILDTGIDRNHPDFRNTMINTHSFYNDNCEDINGHGTHCASIAAGINGVAPEADILAVKVLNDQGRGNELNLLKGIYHSLYNGAQVISYSVQLSNGIRGLSRDPFHEATKQAIQDFNCWVVCAAGNDSNRPNNFYPICSPADAQYALAISAINNQKQFYKRCNRAAYHQIMNFTAPGVDICAAQSHYKRYFDGNLYMSMSGTSMATPFIAGTIALIIEKLEREYGSQNVTFNSILRILSRISSNEVHWQNSDSGLGLPDISQLNNH